MFWRSGAALLAISAFAADALATDFGLPQGSVDLKVGGVALVTPKYEGSKEYEVIGFPFLVPVGLGESGAVQFKGPDDLRFRFLNFNGFEAGPVVGYRFGRDQDDADRLFGLGDVDGGLVVGGFVAYRPGPLGVFASYNHQVTGDDAGGLLRFGVEGKTKFSPAVELTAVLGASYADSDYMDAYFGVNAFQSARSGLAQYDADAGIKDVYFGLTADVALDDRWGLILLGRYSRLLDEAADSPIVETEDQFYGGIGLTYKFTFVR